MSGNEPRKHIPYVHNERGSETFKTFEDAHKRFSLEFEGKTIEFEVYDLRLNNEENQGLSPDEKVQYEKENTSITLYFMGMPQIETIKPNDLTNGILERAKERNQVVIIPRFKEIPATPNIEDDVVIAALSNDERLDEKLSEKVYLLRGKLIDSLANEGIHIDFALNDIEIITYSSGSNVGLQTAELIDNIPTQKRKDGSTPKRALISLSSSSAIDEIPFNEVATGKGHVEGFNRQVTWAVIEETRLRLNSLISAEEAKFNMAANDWISEHGLIERPENYAKLQKLLLDRKNDEGIYEFPCIRNGIKYIDQAPAAFDTRTMLETVSAFLKLTSFPEGRRELVKQIHESSTQNLGMLFDVLRRASTGSNKYTYEQLLDMPEIKVALIGMSEVGNINNQFIPTEHRLDTICDGIKSFDIKAIWPVEDLLATDEAYGATIRRLLMRDNAPVSIQDIKAALTLEVAQEFEESLSNNDNKKLGVLFTENSSSMGKILFPNANSVDIRFEGTRGHMSGSHLAPMKNSTPYLK